MAAAPTVMLADDHSLFRAGLRNLLQAEGFPVVAEQWEEDAVLETIRTARPDIVLIDIRLQGADGGHLLRTVRETHPETRLLVLTTSTDEQDITTALRGGAHGYALKDAPVQELAGAIRAVAGGDGWLSPQVAGTVIGFVRSGISPSASSHEGMSEREIEVLRLLATGLDNNQIARALNISAKTVKNHISSIFAKLGLENRVQAAVYAVRSGIA